MPYYHYKARNAAGELIENDIEADNPTLAAQMISHRGMIPISIVRRELQIDVLMQLRHWLALRQLGHNDLLLLCKQMYSLTKAGIPLINALGNVTESARNPALAAALKDIAKRLKSGSELAQAMSHHKNIFPPLFITIIHAGESTGGLDPAFLRLSHYLERDKETETRIKSALRYPSIVIAALVIATIIVNMYVFPAFRKVFDKIDAGLPWQTKVLVSVSDFMVNFWPPMLIALAIMLAFFLKYISTPSGRLHWDKLILELPIAGSILERSAMERFSRSLAMILSAGVPLIRGLSMVSAAIGNTYIEAKLEQLRIGVEKGESVSRMAKSTQMLPDLIIQMIGIGEETGNISGMLLEAADFYEKELDAELKNLTATLEPILIVIIGIMVLVLALGIFLPMWNLSSAMRL